MPYDIIAGNSFVGADFVGAGGGYDGVNQILGGYDIVGANIAMQLHPPAYAPPPRPQYYAGGNPFAAQQAQLLQAQHTQQLAAQNQQAYLNAALQAKRAQAGLIVNPQAPTASRRLVLGMQSTGTVAAGALATITARPQNLAFKPQRIVIPATIAPDFLITDIKVGNVSQLVQSGTVPAEAFTQQLFDGQMEMDTVNTSQDFVIQVQNTAGSARTFNAAVYGLAVLAR